MDTDALPRFIWVSGLSLLLRGWNGCYTFRLTADRKPEWHLSDHHDRIRHAKIQQNGIGGWELVTDDGFTDYITHCSERDTPLGTWMDGVQVHAENDYKCWFNTNKGIIVTACSVAILLGVGLLHC